MASCTPNSAASACLQHITRATGERQDLPSIFRVVLASLEENLPIDFGCILLHDPTAHSLTVDVIGIAGSGFADMLGLTEQVNVPIDANGLSRCVAGGAGLRTRRSAGALPISAEAGGGAPAGAAVGGHHALDRRENQIFGVLVCARGAIPKPLAAAKGASFLKQLRRARRPGRVIRRGYTAPCNRRTTTLRLRSTHRDCNRSGCGALGQRWQAASRHDINNAISPISLYTESLLEREPNLSERARRVSDHHSAGHRRCGEGTVAALWREFYREAAKAQLTLERVDLNRAVRQVVELTRPRWERICRSSGGAMVELRNGVVGYPCRRSWVRNTRSATRSPI